jgi:hypothetical protein
MVFGLFMVSFSGSEVEEWWKLNDLSDRNFSDVAQLWWWMFFFGGSIDDGWCWISFLQWSFSCRSQF